MATITITRCPPPIIITHCLPSPVAATPMAAVALETAIAARQCGHVPAPPTTTPNHATTPQLPPIPGGPSPVAHRLPPTHTNLNTNTTAHHQPPTTCHPTPVTHLL